MLLRGPGCCGAIRDEVDAIARRVAGPRSVCNRSAPVLYLRTDLSFGVRAGGSVGHIAGVLNELADTSRPAHPADHRAGADGARRHRDAHRDGAGGVLEFPRAAGAGAERRADRDQRWRPRGAAAISFVYQRYSLHNYAGLQLARRLRVPFVLEYNGSEIWMSRHWGRPLNYEDAR